MKAPRPLRGLSGARTPLSRRGRAVRDPTIDSRAVTNLAVGGQFLLKQGGAWTLHGGYATDQSPVGADDTQFTRVDMQAVTVGISGTAKFVLGSVGIRCQAGTADQIVLRQLQGGSPCARN